MPSWAFEGGGLLANNSGGPFMLNDGPTLETQTMLTAMGSANVAQGSDPFGPDPGNYIKVGVGFDFVTPLGGFEGNIGGFVGRNRAGQLQAGPFVEGGPAIGAAFSLDAGIEFNGNLDSLDRSLSINGVVGLGPVNVNGNVNPSPPGKGFFGEFLNGGGASFSAGPLPVEGFISFTGLRSFDVIGFGRSFFEEPRQ